MAFDYDETKQHPRKGSRWIYEDKEVVVKGVRTIVDWEYVYDPYGGEFTYNVELKCFTGNDPTFTPVPVEVKAGQTWEYTDKTATETFVVGEVFEGIAYGRSSFTHHHQPAFNRSWEAEQYESQYLINSEAWELAE